MPFGTASRSPARVIAIGGSAVVVCLLPVFLTGSMATFIQADLHLGAAGLGLAVALYRAAGAICSPTLGRRADRVGATKSLKLATAGAAVACLGIAVTARNTPTLIAWLMLAGCAGALAQPGANRLLAARVDSSRLGLAFGIKQSAPPAASTLAGLSVPLIAATAGWRWGFVAAALVAAVISLGMRPVPRPARPRLVASDPAGRVADRRTVLVLAIAFGLGTSVSSSVTTFFVLSVVERGTSEVLAGTMLAGAGVLAIVVRIVAGLVSDRATGNYLRGCAVLAGIGATGVAALAFAGSEAVQAASLAIALGGIWGFNGVFWFALIDAFPHSPGAITGAVAPGALLGSTVGPIIFGLIAENAGYSSAFGVFTGIALATAAGLLAGNSRLERDA
ncbi:MAG: MFS transporter [Acidimicrobiia bacterium]